MALASGCRNGQLLQESTTTVKDTVWSEVSYTERDTFIIIDSVAVETTINCDSLFKAALINDFSPIKVNRKQAGLTVQPLANGRLQIRCDCDSLGVKARLRDKLEKQFHRRETEIRIKESEKMKPLQWAIWILAIILGLVIIKELKSIFSSND
jgi:hypothetical protein